MDEKLSEKEFTLVLLRPKRKARSPGAHLFQFTPSHRVGEIVEAERPFDSQDCSEFKNWGRHNTKNITRGVIKETHRNEQQSGRLLASQSLSPIVPVVMPPVSMMVITSTPVVWVVTPMPVVCWNKIMLVGHCWNLCNRCGLRRSTNSH